MWWRGVLGGLLCLVGAVFTAQGSGELHGSSMTGEGQWTVIGIILVVAGLALLWWAAHVRRRRMAASQ